MCPDEVFADQPAAAFCSGVLVDWDLVLTAGHCVAFSRACRFFDRVRLLLHRGRQARAGFWRCRSPRTHRGRSPGSGWSRASPGFRLAAPRASGGCALRADTILLAGDDSGSIAEVRDAGGFFIAATDTSAGWSGGAAYDADLVLTGFLSRGALDLIDSPKGCRVAVHAPADAPVEEQFTYGARAVQALCEKEPSRAICAADCGHICPSPCRA